jgi:hypothetical protein
MRIRQALSVRLLAGVGWIVASQAAADTFHEPDGFGKAKFGMSEAQVKALYPQMEVIAEPTVTPNTPPQPFRLAMYGLNNQTVGTLRHCSVELRFFQLGMYEVQFLCPDKHAARVYLQKTFGAPTRAEENSLLWQGQKTAITYAPGSGAFMFGDIAATTKLNYALLALVLQQKGGVTPGTPPTPPAPTAAAQP